MQQVKPYEREREREDHFACDEQYFLLSSKNLIEQNDGKA